MYEELQRGRADELLGRIPEDVKGEYAIVVAGKRPSTKG